jgi:hypothetical protein
LSWRDGLRARERRGGPSLGSVLDQVSGYARVSTIGQTLAKQKAELKEPRAMSVGVKANSSVFAAKGQSSQSDRTSNCACIAINLNV